MEEFRLYLNQKEIAEASGLTQSYISLILKGDRQPTLETVDKLMNATGVCREAWLWPEDHYNPYVPFTDGKQCLLCARRIRMYDWLLKKAEDYLAGNPVPQTLQDIADALLVYVSGSNK